jgi:hypothetical protein
MTNWLAPNPFGLGCTRCPNPDRDPRVAITYEMITPESAEEGLFADTGWIDEEGVSMQLDEWEVDEGTTLAEKTAKYLYDQGAWEPSSTWFHEGIWYTEYGESDFRTGEVENRSYHLRDFTEMEQGAVYNELHKLTRRR